METKVKRLGLDWGAAFEEAEPISIKRGSAEVQIYHSERSELVIEVPADSWIEPAKVFDSSHGIQIRIRTDR